MSSSVSISYLNAPYKDPLYASCFHLRKVSVSLLIDSTRLQVKFKIVGLCLTLAIVNRINFSAQF